MNSLVVQVVVVILACWNVQILSARIELFEGQTCIINSTTSGRCKKLDVCEEAKKGLSRNELPVVCSYDRFIPIVCCPHQATTVPPPPPTIRPPSNKTGVKSKEMCQKYAEAVWRIEKLPVLLLDEEESYLNISECGMAEHHLFVIGGEQANPKEFPHMAAIGFGNKDNIYWMCGGSLISDRFVLSAAHCTEDPNPRGRGYARWVRLGDLNLNSTEDDAKPEDIAIIERIVHPGYKYPIKYNDIALFRLERPVTFSGYIRPACLNTDFEIRRQKCTATGWGKISAKGRNSQELMKVDLPVLPTQACKNTFGAIGSRLMQTILKDGIVEESMVCAGELKGGKDTCQGDSGGPLQYIPDGPYCMYSIYGITSFGRGCAEPNSPAIYTRVSHYIDWIEHIVWPEP